MITYNHEKYIAQAIESVLMQKTSFPFELLIGEDCSTDGTRKIVREYQEKYPSVIRAFLREENTGGRQNFRRIYQNSRGKYVALLEGDDYWTATDKLQKQVDLLDARPDIVLCGHHSIFHYEDGSQPDETSPGLPAGVYGLKRILHRNIFHTSSAVFRRILEDCCPEWRMHLKMGDVPLYIELAQHGDVYLFAEVMSVYRIHPGGIWSRLTALQKERYGVEMYNAFRDHLKVDANHQDTIRKGCFTAVYRLGQAEFLEGEVAETRRCLHECFRISRPLESLPEKFQLAVKGYGWWLFPPWRLVRRYFQQALRL